MTRALIVVLVFALGGGLGYGLSWQSEHTSTTTVTRNARLAPRIEALERLVARRERTQRRYNAVVRYFCASFRSGRKYKAASDYALTVTNILAGECDSFRIPRVPGS